MNRYQRRVKRGADYLTARDGVGWIDRINLWRLDIDSQRHCVLAQLAASSDFFRTNEFSRHPGGLWMLRRGFLVPRSPLSERGSLRFERSAARLTQAWRDYIVAARLARLSKEDHDVPFTA